jgi:hypothetical protein
VRRVPANAYQQAVLDVLENPARLWRGAFEQEISEAARSLLLVLYSLGCDTPLERLQPAWAFLHQHRVKRYNFRAAPEDWRGALQELEGGFLSLLPGKVVFANPSVKDFLEWVYCTHADHMVDLLASVHIFEQITHFWEFMASEKGAELRLQIAADPVPLLSAIERVLWTPSTQRVSFAGGGYVIKPCDTRPETRLRTLVKMAAMLRSKHLQALAEKYINALPKNCQDLAPDYDNLVGALSDLDKDYSKAHSVPSLYSAVKAAILGLLAEEPCIEGFAALADYAETSDARPLHEPERRDLAAAFGHYLDEFFSEDLNNADREGELEELGGRLQKASEMLEISVEGQQEEVSEKLETIYQRAEENGDQIRSWQGGGTGMDFERAEDEQEIRRLFDGLAETT